MYLNSGSPLSCSPGLSDISSTQISRPSTDFPTLYKRVILGWSFTSFSRNDVICSYTPPLPSSLTVAAAVDEEADAVEEDEAVEADVADVVGSFFSNTKSLRTAAPTTSELNVYILITVLNPKREWGKWGKILPLKSGTVLKTNEWSSK